jgi:adenylosuccinate synthase
VIIDPPALRREAAHLASLGVHAPEALLVIHPRCLVTTFWHRTLNRLRELARGGERHGSCGQGIGEARSYWLRYGGDALFAADLRDAEALRGKLELLRQRALLELQELTGKVAGPDLRELDLWHVDTEAVAADLAAALHPAVELSAAMPACTTAIFEGAQGALLDEYRGFHPHTTWSTVTPHHAWELVRQMGADAVTVLGITRAYTTRHGDGPLPTYCPTLTERLPDPGNPRNAWQGGLRCGWLDLPLLRYAAAACGPLDGLVVNHLDHVADDFRIAEAYRGMTLEPTAAPDLVGQAGLNDRLKGAEPVWAVETAEGLVRRLSAVAPVVLTGAGPTHEGRRLLGLRFRQRASSRRADVSSAPTSGSRLDARSAIHFAATS